MNDKPLFPQLRGAPHQPPLSPEELDGMWYAVRSGIRKPKHRRFPFLAAGIAASLLIMIALTFVIKGPSTPEEPVAVEASILSETITDVPPMIEDWDGTPSFTYEGEHNAVKVAFIVDQSVAW
ncbi:MAG TPA: hypothetical protein PK014_14740 [Thermoanaerobaculia bacterium]|nr:hypothetical protein [Thermoanaerobaculia bacterium]HUM31283.1 hypothetical protein [Thermoanaerobaculia bacterium]HXK69646.1 hypothetical protein [Thermoanaerobaculia bacterium]